MFRLKSLDHVVLRVTDVERCLDFYETVLGCTVDQARADIGLYQLRAGDSIVDLADVAGPVVFLAGDAAAMITGQIIAVDGGYTAQ